MTPLELAVTLLAAFGAGWLWGKDRKHKHRMDVQYTQELDSGVYEVVTAVFRKCNCGHFDVVGLIGRWTMAQITEKLGPPLAQDAELKRLRFMAGMPEVWRQ